MQFKSIFFLALLGLSLGTPQRQTNNQGRGGGDRPDRQRVPPPRSTTPPPPPPTCPPQIESPFYKKPEECYLGTDGKITKGLLETFSICAMENSDSLTDIVKCCKANENPVSEKVIRRIKDDCINKEESNKGAKFSHLLCLGVHPADIVQLADCEANINNDSVDKLVACAFPKKEVEDSSEVPTLAVAPF